MGSTTVPLLDFYQIKQDKMCSVRKGTITPLILLPLSLCVCRWIHPCVHRRLLADIEMSKHLFTCVFVCLLQGCGCALGGQRITFGRQSSLPPGSGRRNSSFGSEYIYIFLRTHLFGSPPYSFWIRVSHWRSLLFWLDWLVNKLLGSACLCPQVLSL